MLRKREEKEGVIKSAGMVSLGTLFSRITGLIRLQIIAYIFGYSPATDAFWLAFTLPNLFRALLAEGALSTAFIPIFSEWYSKKGEEEAWKLANNILNLLVLMVMSVIVMGVILAPFYMPYLGIGFRKNPSQVGLAIYLSQLMWPFLLFISVAALIMAILNCRGHFASPAFAPVFFNICFIIFALLLSNKIGIYSLACGVVAGGSIQLLVQIPALIKKGFKYRLTFSLQDEGVRRVFKLILPAILGSITLQISVVITRIFASTLPAGGISSLQYAMRIIQFPLGLFPIAISTAIFPRFSLLAATNNRDALKATVNMGIRMVFFLLVPSSIGLILLRKELVGLLFQYGSFSYRDTLITSEALFYYCFGLFAMGGVMILTRAFYSLQDMLTPFYVFVICLGSNVLLNFALIDPLKHKGLALATSLSIMMNMVFLVVLLRRKMGRLGGYSVFLSFLKTCFVSAVMGGAIYIGKIFLNPGLAVSLHYRLLFIVGTIFFGVGVFIGLSYLLRSNELDLIIRSLRGG